MGLYQLRKPLEQNVHYFLKWIIISCLIGCVGGVIGGFFAKCVIWATDFRQGHDWTLYLMPVAGLMIISLYHVFHEEKNKGTNMVIEAISSDKEVSFATGPLIFVSTILTHFVGGSSGREGAALQLGGSIGNAAGHLIRLDDKDRKIAVMCGMSAVFGALFGTPVAAGIFSMEVVRVGVMYYAALVPCLFSAFLGAGISGWMGIEAESYQILGLPKFDLPMAAYMVLLGIMCAFVSIGFCMMLHQSEKLYRKRFENPYIRILAASGIFIALTLLSGTRDYNGGGLQLIEEAMEGHVRYEAFLMKALFTAAALGAGFKGGEIVPTLCIGSTFGCMTGQIMGISPSFSAACGMVALFVGVTNCPISTMMIALELFGGDGLWFFAIVISVTFTLSGYYGLYSSQRFAYSKTSNEFIDRKSNK
ncbi:MAG: chloride channel protein [Lachnospiraceae bacterium]|nr:chloride channel protein [Lachnospiraceae bacterium]